MRIKIEKQVHLQRLVLGLICGLLPIGCILFGLIGADEALLDKSWWYSISATYFSNSQVWMIGSLVLSSFFFATYRGYDAGDRVLTTVSSISSICIVLFPCYNRVFERCGLFMLPTSVSGKIHNVSAAILFISFAVMILTQFTKGHDKKRNIVYYICGLIIVLAMLSQVITTILHIDWMTIVNEFIMLEAFAVAWIVKSQAIIIKSTKGRNTYGAYP
jgi:hypothetical protein